MECIIFRTQNWTTRTTDFYGVAVPVDLGLGNNTDPFFLKPALTTDRPSHSAFVSLGSSLFCVGGDILTHTLEGLTKIYQLDAAAGEADLMMLTPRARPSVVAMDGNLYIMGGNIFRSKGLWGECFDLCSKKSSPLPLPPPLPPSGGHLDDWNDVPFVVAPLHFYKQILVVVALPSASNVAVVYHVEDKVWKKLDHEIDFSGIKVHGNAVVLVDRFLCWIQACKGTVRVQAYDLFRKKWSISPIKDLDKVGNYEDLSFCSLFRLDDTHLCFLWEDSLGYLGHNLLHCTKVGVSISEAAGGETIFDFFGVSSQSYVIGRGAALIDGFSFCLGEGDDGRTEAVNITTPNQVPDQGSKGGSSSGGSRPGCKDPYSYQCALGSSGGCGGGAGYTYH